MNSPARTILLTAMLVTATACTSGISKSAEEANDRAIAEAVLMDFANWNEATLDELAGVLAIAPMSVAQVGLLPHQVEARAPNIRAHVTDGLTVAFIKRNAVARPIDAVVAGSRWTLIKPVDPGPSGRDLPPGVKAIGTLTWPGITADGGSALIQLIHTWSLQSSRVTTYVLAKNEGAWHIVARDQKAID